jgi:hypothetical protein
MQFLGHPLQQLVVIASVGTVLIFFLLMILFGGHRPQQQTRPPAASPTGNGSQDAESLTTPDGQHGSTNAELALVRPGQASSQP